VWEGYLHNVRPPRPPVSHHVEFSISSPACWRSIVTGKGQSNKLQFHSVQFQSIPIPVQFQIGIPNLPASKGGRDSRTDTNIRIDPTQGLCAERGRKGGTDLERGERREREERDERETRERRERDERDETETRQTDETDKDRRDGQKQTRRTETDRDRRTGRLNN
jgi:hypothetical protein